MVSMPAYAKSPAERPREGVVPGVTLLHDSRIRTHRLPMVAPAANGYQWLRG